MEIFISWSKDTSKKVAQELSDFINTFFNSRALKIHVSAKKIEAGDQWRDHIGEAIARSSMCIMIFTTENEFSRWMYFESGAIACGTRESSRIIPFLFNGSKLDADSPVVAYQYVQNNEEGIKKILKSVKKVGKLKSVKESDFDRHFDDLYPDFSDTLAKIAAQPSPIEHKIPFSKIFPDDILSVSPDKIFLGAAMAGLGSSSAYSAHRHLVNEVAEAIEICCSQRQVYWAGRNINNTANFHGGQKALGIDLGHLKESSICVFLYMERIVTSVIVEIGYAIALNKPIVIFCKDRNDLPFLLQYSDKQISNLRIYECEDTSAIIDLIKSDDDAIIR